LIELPCIHSKIKLHVERISLEKPNPFDLIMQDIMRMDREAMDRYRDATLKRAQQILAGTPLDMMDFLS
jgi:hypothetical protein